MIKPIPLYVYSQSIGAGFSLSQGDIIRVDGKFREYFSQFYPAIDHSGEQDRYVMILTQSCDLVKTDKRKPKLSHVNVCLVRSLKDVIKKLLAEEIKPISIAGQELLLRDALDQLKDRLSKLLNNTDQKTHFFLPKQSPFTTDMVAILSMSFSFRTDHYDLLLENRVLGLKTEFQAKVGHIISQLYGRIGTHDLADFDWTAKDTRNFINDLLRDLNLKPVQDKKVIDYIQANISDNAGVDELIQECEALRVADSFRPLKNELMQNVKNKLIRLFENKEKIDRLQKLEKKDLAKEVSFLLREDV